MDCRTVRIWLFRKLDGELSSLECEQLDAHLVACDSCSREMKILLVPQRVGLAIPSIEPSPFFYSRLKARIESESRGSITLWQMILGIRRQVVPAFGAITLALLLALAYLQVHRPTPDLYQVFDSVFTTGDRTKMAIIEGEITDESVLLAIADSGER